MLAIDRYISVNYRIPSKFLILFFTLYNLFSKIFEGTELITAKKRRKIDFVDKY